MHVPFYFFATSDLLYVWEKASPEGKAIIFTLAVFSIFAWSVMAAKGLQIKRLGLLLDSGFLKRRGHAKLQYNAQKAALLAHAASTAATFFKKVIMRKS